MRKLIAISAIAMAGHAQADVIAYSVEIVNMRTRDISVEFSSYPSTEQARTGDPEYAKQRGRFFLEVMKLAPGEKNEYSTTRRWIRWCQLEPPSSLPCGVADGGLHHSKITFE